MEGHGRSWKVMEGQGSLRKVMAGLSHHWNNISGEKSYGWWGGVGWWPVRL